MPELAEVEFYRKEWDRGLHQEIVNVLLHGRKRIFRGVDCRRLCTTLIGAKLLGSKAHGKQMLFEFSKDAWLGIHLGMTGKLQVEAADFTPGKHDHLVLQQPKQSLVFSDPRLFGRVLFDVNRAQPGWWAKMPPPLLSSEFTARVLEHFLQRHRKAPIKAVLLMQQRFPGIGNWMADEILWRAGIHPQTAAGNLAAARCKILYRKTRHVCRHALRIVGSDFSDPPKSWLFPHRWARGGNCPRCGGPLNHATIGGRTTCWCPKCQPC